MLKALLTDIDGTITDPTRRIHTGAIETIRSLVDQGVEVVLASGNTSCFMDALCKMIGTQGTFIAENGGVFRIGFTGTLRINGDQSCLQESTGSSPGPLSGTREKNWISSVPPTGLPTLPLPGPSRSMK